MPTITVIVPVYMVEQYLRRYIDSILSQTFTDFELILIDDGSPDNCGAICDEYTAQDARVRVIHKENGGVSSARNAGLDAVCGEWVAFCDSDDYCGSDYLKTFVALSRFSADWILTGFHQMDEQGQIISKNPRRPGKWNLNTENDRITYIFSQILFHGTGWSVWDSLFRVSVIRDNQIRFCTSCENFAEDMCFTLEYALHCNTVVATEECNYYYVERTGSMMMTSKQKIRLNELNEISIQFANRFFRVMKEKQHIKQFPVIFWLIMQNQYLQICLSFRKKQIDTNNKYFQSYHMAFHRRWRGLIVVI